MLRRRVAELLEAAERLDVEVATVLDKLQPFSPGPTGQPIWDLRDLVNDAKAVAAFAGYTDSALPEPGTDPDRAAAWWASVAPDDKALLLRAFPQHLGGLDGLPAETTGHGSYWQAGSMSLTNQAAIVVGHYLLVKLDHGSLPTTDACLQFSA